MVIHSLCDLVMLLLRFFPAPCLQTESNQKLELEKTPLQLVGFSCFHNKSLLCDDTPTPSFLPSPLPSLSSLCFHSSEADSTLKRCLAFKSLQCIPSGHGIGHEATGNLLCCTRVQRQTNLQERKTSVCPSVTPDYCPSQANIVNMPNT